VEPISHIPSGPDRIRRCSQTVTTFGFDPPEQGGWICGEATQPGGPRVGVPKLAAHPPDVGGQSGAGCRCGRCLPRVLLATPNESSWPRSPTPSTG